MKKNSRMRVMKTWKTSQLTRMKGLGINKKK